MKRHMKTAEEKEAASASAGTSASPLLSSSSSPSADDDDTETKSKEFDGAVTSSTPAKRAKKNIMTPGLTAAPDRTKLSSRQAASVLAETAKSLGQDLCEVNVNRMSIHRHREKNRSKSVSQLTKLPR